MRRKDEVQITMFGGISLAMVMLSLCFVIMPASGGQADLSLLLSSVMIGRVTLILVYLMFACAIVVQVFNSYSINYLYIFEFDPKHKMTH